MKKTYSMKHPKIKIPRLIEAAKGNINKYLKRESKKKLSAGVDYWDFECKFGPNAKESKTIHVAEIGKFIDAAEKQELESFYVEILVKPGRRTKKPKSDSIKPTS